MTTSDYIALGFLGGMITTIVIVLCVVAACTYSKLTSVEDELKKQKLNASKA